MSVRASVTNDEKVLVPLLAARSYHLPGNTWCQDWNQYMRNNHILFGICLHNKLHPLEWWERILALIGSIAFGCAATNIAYLWDQHNKELSNLTIVEIWGGYAITMGVLVLWTFGGVLHSVFDHATWHIMACACCHPGGRWGDRENARRYKDCGSYLLIPVVGGVVTLAVIVVLIRANEQAKQADASSGNTDDDYLTTWSDTNNSYEIKQFSFLSEYAIEMALAWFVYFPVVGTILFSGILGCGRLPILGGRPRDKRLIEEASETGEGPWYFLWGGLPPFQSINRASV